MKIFRAGKVKFEDDVIDIIKEQELLDVDVGRSSFDPDKLVITLHRSDRVNYIKTGAESRDKLSRAIEVLLIDRQGNAHKRRIDFLPNDLAEDRNYLRHSRA